MFDEEALMWYDIELALQRLRPEDRDLVLLCWRIGPEPEDWSYPWPARLSDIGTYIGQKYYGRALSEAAIRYRRDELKAMWQGENG